MRLKSKDEELEHFRALENERRQHESTEGERQKGAVTGRLAMFRSPLPALENDMHPLFPSRR